jgi:hypothetical protein
MKAEGFQSVESVEVPPGFDPPPFVPNSRRAAAQKRSVTNKIYESACNTGCPLPFHTFGSAACFRDRIQSEIQPEAASYTLLI